jgi:hypothetical protein
MITHARARVNKPNPRYALMSVSGSS